MNANGTYGIRFNDGDVEPSEPADHIQKMTADQAIVAGKTLAVWENNSKVGEIERYKVWKGGSQVGEVKIS